MATYINDKETLERLARLEMKTDLKFAEHEKAIVLAKDTVEHRLHVLNDHQKRMDRLEITFASNVELKSAKESLEKQISVLTKFVYVAVGIFAALEFFLRYVNR